MIMKSRLLKFAFLTAILVLFMPASIIFAGQGQFSRSSLAQELVRLAESAEQQVKTLIDAVRSNGTVIEIITDVELFDELEGNVTLCNQGTTTLTEAQDALELMEYDAAIRNATDALQIFREIFLSINSILGDAGFQTGAVVDAYGLLEAHSRALERIEYLRELLPEEATELTDLLNQAEVLLDLDTARLLLLEGKVNEVKSKLTQANQLISDVYQYLKQQAEESNNFRINGYLQEMEQARERIRERFRYAGDQGVDVGSIMESVGYSNETEFMQALENMTQIAHSKIGDIDSVIPDLVTIGQLTRRINQSLTQEINRHQEQHGTGGSGNGPGGGTGGASGSGAGSGNNGSGSGAGTSGSGQGIGSGNSGAGASGGEGSVSGNSGSSSNGSGASGFGVGGASSGSSLGNGGSSGGSGSGGGFGGSRSGSGTE